METVQIQLPAELAKIVRQETSSSEELSQILTEALRLWLDKRHANTDEKTKTLEFLRQSGLVMTKEKQRAFAEAMIAKIPHDKMPLRKDVETALASLKISLSDEIIIMRGGDE